jgi:hypothetical protein
MGFYGLAWFFSIEPVAATRRMARRIVAPAQGS